MLSQNNNWNVLIADLVLLMMVSQTQLTASVSQNCKSENAKVNFL